MTVYGFIGVGNMGSALARACAKNPETTILLANRTPEKAERLAEELRAQALSVVEVAARADVLLIGVKPQNLAELFAEIGPVLQQRETPVVLVSMAAGRTIAQIRELAYGAESAAQPIIRIMPNLPVSIGEGITLVCSDGVSGEILGAFMVDFEASGDFTLLSESQFDAGMAISGCAPAFAFMFANALAQGGIACGLSEVIAHVLAQQTMKGAAVLMQDDTRSPEELIRAVCSPGGTTIEGVQVLEGGNLDALVQAAVKASFEKASRM